MNDIHSNIIKEDLISNNNSISNSQNIFYNSIEVKYATLKIYQRNKNKIKHIEAKI